MTPKRTDAQKRKDLILGIVVDRYVKTISPVSSTYIAKEFPIDLSSATIRNILSELESEGYLTHPHTSAGRMPTQLGYRYYVDFLMEEIQLLAEEKTRIKKEYQREVLELGQLLDKTSEYISQMTNCTSIISIDGMDEKLFLRGTSNVVGYYELKDFVRIRHILNALEEKELLLKVINRDIQKKCEVYIGNELKCSNIEGCSLVVSKYKLDEGHSGRLAVLGPTRMNYRRVISALNYFSDLMEEIY